MGWLDTFKEIWWLLGVLLLILGALWKLAIQTNHSKERLQQVADNEKSIKVLKNEMCDIKDDLSEIKQSVDRQGHDTSAMLNLLQSITLKLSDQQCDINAARDKFNDYLSNR